ncbi:MAG: hypothetical protein AB8F78_15740 [Saprospiraceae bacterium]
MSQIFKTYQLNNKLVSFFLLLLIASVSGIGGGLLNQSYTLAGGNIISLFLFSSVLLSPPHFRGANSIMVGAFTFFWMYYSFPWLDNFINNERIYISFLYTCELVFAYLILSIFFKKIFNPNYLSLVCFTVSNIIITNANQLIEVCFPLNNLALLLSGSSFIQGVMRYTGPLLLCTILFIFISSLVIWVSNVKESKFSLPLSILAICSLAFLTLSTAHLDFIESFLPPTTVHTSSIGIFHPKLDCKVRSELPDSTKVSILLTSINEYSHLDSLQILTPENYIFDLGTISRYTMEILPSYSLGLLTQELAKLPNEVSINLGGLIYSGPYNSSDTSEYLLIKGQDDNYYAKHNVVISVSKNNLSLLSVKSKLVPFEESTPYYATLGSFLQRSGTVGTFSNTFIDETILEPSLLANRINLESGPLICYETWFPDSWHRKSKSKFASVILNECWMNSQIAANQFLRATVGNAAALGIPVFISSNGGISGRISPKNQATTVLAYQAYSPDLLVFPRDLKKHQRTTYAKYGPVLSRFVEFALISIWLIAMHRLKG